MRNNKVTKLIIILLLAVMTLSGCDSSLPLASHSGKNSKNDITASYPAGSYDSFDTAVITDINTAKKKITFYNYNLARTYKLNYSGATCYADKYGTSVALSQLSVGDMVDLWFLKDSKKLVAMCESTETFTQTDITDFEINSWAKTFTTGGTTYRVSKDTFVCSEDKSIKLDELNPIDNVTLRGRGNTIESIVVENGHGYVQMEGADYFVNGYIEVGKKLIYQITDKMLIMVPEGDYPVRITSRGTEVLRNISVSRNEETTIDLSDVDIDEEKKAAVKISINPEGATVTIDGQSINKDYPVYCSYGMHKLVATASGYKKLTRYFNVDANTKELKVSMVELDKDDVSGNDDSNKPGKSDTSTSDSTSGETSDGETSTSSDETSSDGDVSGNNNSSTSDSTSTSTSGSNSTDTSDSGSASGSDSTSTSDEVDDEKKDEDDKDKNRIYYITIPAPAGVEVYWDGNYMGLAPISIKKVSGTHVITLRKTGFETRSFTVMIEDSKEDISYTFDELPKKSD
ncbi:MAG: PEGA domain-containing protein [Lachnospiraceae bacterium]|nr:PEGA domain-containing protein [Lachnospiraceae bacterium]